MKIVALDTGGVAQSCGAILVALEVASEDAQVRAVAHLHEPRELGGALIPTLAHLLEEAGWGGPETVDGLVIGSGPGSWTSLRVGFATWKTLAQTLGKPFLAVATFDALAAATQRAILDSLPRAHGKNKREPMLLPHLTVALARCRPGELYGKLFLLSSEFVSVAQVERIAPVKDFLDAAFSQALADELADSPLLLIGSAASEAASWLHERGERERFQLLEIPPEAVAVEIALQGAFAIAEGQVPALESVEPLYLAPSSAERNRLLGM